MPRLSRRGADIISDLVGKAGCSTGREEMATRRVEDVRIRSVAPDASGQYIRCQANTMALCTGRRPATRACSTPPSPLFFQSMQTIASPTTPPRA
jgi:hypothetical protein